MGIERVLSGGQVDIEELWARLGEAAASAKVAIDHERLAEHGRPWTLVVSGTALGDGVFVRAEEGSLDRCLEVGLSRLIGRSDEWAWLSEYLPGSSGR